MPAPVAALCYRALRVPRRGHPAEECQDAVAGAPDRTYAVTFRNGRIEGSGVIEWGNGDRYEGAFADGRRSGRGTLAWAAGGSYEGDFVDGHLTGRGVQVLPNGARYEGDFADGEMVKLPFTSVPLVPMSVPACPYPVAVEDVT